MSEKEKVNYKNYLKEIEELDALLVKTREVVDRIPVCTIGDSLRTTQDTYETKVRNLTQKEVLTHLMDMIRKNPQKYAELLPKEETEETEQNPPEEESEPKPEPVRKKGKK